jgi:hypothetical protein
MHVLFARDVKPLSGLLPLQVLGYLHIRSGNP